MRSKPVIKSFVMNGGERYVLLVDYWSGLPLYYPNLFVTTQVRNASLSLAAMESALGGVAVLLRFMSERGDDLEDRFRKHKFFESHELDAIRDFCQIKFRARTLTADPKGLFTLEELQDFDVKVSSQVVYVRLTVISRYVKWLSRRLSGENLEKEVSLRIDNMANGLVERRPEKKKRNEGLVEKGLNKKQLDILFELFRPESEFNPFEDPSVKIRNRLMILMLYHLGLRGGELLNIRIRDIDFSKNQLVVERRADELDDPRIDQALVKTLDRRLPLRDTLVKEIHSYILHVRKKIVRPGQPDFLFVTHKSGPTKGQPISKSAYKKVIRIVRYASPDLYNMTGHDLRHTWNERFSNSMDTMDNPPNEVRQEEMRSYLMGWKQGSGTAATYNRRFVERKAHESALKLQEGQVRLPKDMKDE